MVERKLGGQDCVVVKFPGDRVNALRERALKNRVTVKMIREKIGTVKRMQQLLERFALQFPDLAVAEIRELGGLLRAHSMHTGCDMSELICLVEDYELGSILDLVIQSRTADVPLLSAADIDRARVLVQMHYEEEDHPRILYDLQDLPLL